MRRRRRHHRAHHPLPAPLLARHPPARARTCSHAPGEKWGANSQPPPTPPHPILPSRRLYATFKRSAEKTDSLPTAPAALHLELVGRTAAFELLAALTALVPKEEFENGGRLFKACEDDANLRRRLPEASGKGAKTKLTLPPGPVTAALARRFHVAAYSALIEFIVVTQSDAAKVAKVLFLWKELWENVVDTTRQWDLKAETSWQPAREADQLGLHARAKARAPDASSKYLASQALASSSLSQDIDMIDDAPHAVPLSPEAEVPADAEAAAGGGGAAAAAGAAAEVVQNAAFLRVGDTWPLAALLPREPPDEEGAAAAILLERDPTAAGVVVAKAAGGGVGEGLWGAECALRLGKQWFRNVAESEYELDELNEQPIMQALLRGVDSLRRRGLEGRDGVSGMPLWMHQLHAKLDAPALLKAGDTLRVEASGTIVTQLVRDASGLAVDGRAVGLWQARPLLTPLTVTLQGVMGRWGEFIDLSRSVHPPLPALVQPGDKLKVLKDGTLEHVGSRQKLPRTDAPRAALPRTDDDVIEVPPHAATAAGATMTLPQGASFVNPAAGRLLLNPSETAPQVQLTIARLVLNRQALFRPHARHWARPLLQLVFDSLSDPLRAGADGEHCLHYLARDLLTLVCSWPADALPADDAAATLVSDLLEKLFKLCQDHNTALQRERNVRIVKRVLEQWGPRLSVRRKMVLMLLRSNSKDEKAAVRAKTTGLHLLNAIVSNELSAADDAALAVGMAGGAYERVGRDSMLKAVLAITIDARGYDPKTKKPLPPRRSLYVNAAQLLGQLLAQAQAEGDAVGAAEPQRKLAVHLTSLMAPTEANTRTLCELLDCVSAEFPAVLLLRSGGGLSFAAHCATLLSKARVFGDARVKAPASPLAPAQSTPAQSAPIHLPLGPLPRHRPHLLTRSSTAWPAPCTRRPRRRRRLPPPTTTKSCRRSRGCSTTTRGIARSSWWCASTRVVASLQWCVSSPRSARHATPRRCCPCCVPWTRHSRATARARCARPTTSCSSRYMRRMRSSTSRAAPSCTPRCCAALATRTMPPARPRRTAPLPRRSRSSPASTTPRQACCGHRCARRWRTTGTRRDCRPSCRRGCSRASRRSTPRPPRESGCRSRATRCFASRPTVRPARHPNPRWPCLARRTHMFPPTDRPTDQPTDCPTACAPPWQHQRMSRYSSRRPSTRIAS